VSHNTHSTQHSGVLAVLGVRTDTRHQQPAAILPRTLARHGAAAQEGAHERRARRHLRRAVGVDGGAVEAPAPASHADASDEAARVVLRGADLQVVALARQQRER